MGSWCLRLLIREVSAYGRSKTGTGYYGSIIYMEYLVEQKSYGVCSIPLIKGIDGV